MDQARTRSWVDEAIAQSHEDLRIRADGPEIHYRAWGRRDDPLVVLVHGGGAHSGWWDHVAPSLASDHRVVAPDLSGHGDSDWRRDYALELWADEVLAVAAAESAAPPLVFGHSLGGFVALTAALEHPSRVRALACIDVAVREDGPDNEKWFDAGLPQMPTRVYPDRKTAESRFRTLPDQGARDGSLTPHIANQSVRAVDGGWTWKFDPAVFAHARMTLAQLRPIGCRTLLLRAERGLTTRDLTDRAVERLGTLATSAELLDSGHHVPIEQPLPLIAVLAALTSLWS